MGARISAPTQTSPEAHPASCTEGSGSFQLVQRPGRGVEDPPPSSAEVKERVELYLYSLSEPSWPVLGWILLTMHYDHWYRCLQCELFTCVLIFKLVIIKNINIPAQVRMIVFLLFWSTEHIPKIQPSIPGHLYIKVYCRPSHQRTSYIRISEIMGKNLMVQEFLSAMGTWEISGLECQLVKWLPGGRHFCNSQQRISYYYCFYFFF